MYILITASAAYTVDRVIRPASAARQIRPCMRDREPLIKVTFGNKHTIATEEWLTSQQYRVSCERGVNCLKGLRAMYLMGHEMQCHCHRYAMRVTGTKYWQTSVDASCRKPSSKRTANKAGTDSSWSAEPRTLRPCVRHSRAARSFRVRFRRT